MDEETDSVSSSMRRVPRTRTTAEQAQHGAEGSHVIAHKFTHRGNQSGCAFGEGRRHIGHIGHTDASGTPGTQEGMAVWSRKLLQTKAAAAQGQAVQKAQMNNSATEPTRWASLRGCLSCGRPRCRTRHLVTELIQRCDATNARV